MHCQAFAQMLLLALLFSDFTRSVSVDPGCELAERKHLAYTPYEFCPDVLTEQTGAHYSSFYQCPPLPHRRCVQLLPDNFIAPTNAIAFRHNPPSENVRLSMPDSRFPDFKGFASRVNEDCVTCWRFEEERRRWARFLKYFERVAGIRLVNGPVGHSLTISRREI